MTNQQIILDTLIEQQKPELDKTSSSDEYFNLFVTEQILKNHELSYNEIIEDVVETGSDGGIDSITYQKRPTRL